MNISFDSLEPRAQAFIREKLAGGEYGTAEEVVNSAVLALANVPAAAPEVGTLEWGRMNARRSELIRKDLTGAITPVEAEELERLQLLSLAAVNAALPRRLPDYAKEVEGLHAELVGRPAGPS